MGGWETGRQEEVMEYSNIKRQQENIVELRERRRYSRAKRQEDQKTGGEYCGTAREEEILQS